METVKKPLENVEIPAVAQQTKPDHREKIKSQVLAKIGRPPRLDRIEVCAHHNGKYRVNIWEQPEPNKEIAVTFSPRIGPSYFITVSETGEIVSSNPPLTRLA